MEVLQRKVCSYPKSLGSKGVRATSRTSTTALEMPSLIELGSHARGMRTNPRDHGASTAVCEGPLDKEQRRRPPELEELECARRDNRRPTQAGRAARSQLRSMDDDESTKVSTVLKSAGCRSTFGWRLSWTERRPQGANRAGNRIVVGGGRKTAGHFHFWS